MSNLFVTVYPVHVVPLLSAVGNHTGWAEAFAGFLLYRLATRCVTSVPLPVIALTLAARERRRDEEVFRCGTKLPIQQPNENTSDIVGRLLRDYLTIIEFNHS